MNAINHHLPRSSKLLLKHIQLHIYMAFFADISYIATAKKTVLQTHQLIWSYAYVKQRKIIFNGKEYFFPYCVRCRVLLFILSNFTVNCFAFFRLHACFSYQQYTCILVCVNEECVWMQLHAAKECSIQSNGSGLKVRSREGNCTARYIHTYSHIKKSALYAYAHICKKERVWYCL